MRVKCRSIAVLTVVLTVASTSGLESLFHDNILCHILLLYLTFTEYVERFFSFKISIKLFLLKTNKYVIFAFRCFKLNLENLQAGLRFDWQKEKTKNGRALSFHLITSLLTVKLLPKLLPRSYKTTVVLVAAGWIVGKETADVLECATLVAESVFTVRQEMFQQFCT